MFGPTSVPSAMALDTSMAYPPRSRTEVKPLIRMSCTLREMRAPASAGGEVVSSSEKLKDVEPRRCVWQSQSPGRMTGTVVVGVVRETSTGRELVGRIEWIFPDLMMIDMSFIGFPRPGINREVLIRCVPCSADEPVKRDELGDCWGASSRGVGELVLIRAAAVLMELSCVVWDC